MKLKPATLSRRQNHRLLIGAVCPRPIAFVSTLGPGGRTNLAPFSFHGVLCGNPPIVYFSAGSKGEDRKDTVKNVEYQKEFVLNVLEERLVEAAVKASGNYEYGVSEIEVTGLTPVPSDLVKPPRIAESPINMECRLMSILQLGDRTHYVVMGEVVLFHVRDEILVPGEEPGEVEIDVSKYGPIGRLNGDRFCRSLDIFERGAFMPPGGFYTAQSRSQIPSRPAPVPSSSGRT